MLFNGFILQQQKKNLVVNLPQTSKHPIKILSNQIKHITRFTLRALYHYLVIRIITSFA